MVRSPSLNALLWPVLWAAVLVPQSRATVTVAPLSEPIHGVSSRRRSLLVGRWRFKAQPIVGLQLVKATNVNVVVADLTDDVTVSRTSDRVAIRAVTRGRTRSVVFVHTTNGTTVRTVASNPFVLCGASAHASCAAWSVPGTTHTITATSYTCRQARCGATATPLTISFAIQDPCHAYRYTSCDTCTKAKCVWCGSDADCQSIAAAVPAQGSCTASDYRDTCPNMTTNPYTDPLYDSMAWLYDMIRVRDVWKEGITGKGIGIRINDDGVDHLHTEFAAKFDVSNSCTIYQPEEYNDDFNHGTTCASIAAASGNSTCSVGIAPEARLSACRVFRDDDDGNATPEADDFSYLYVKMSNMHISSNSYGAAPCEYLEDRRQRRRTLACPFAASLRSPCSATECASVNWATAGPSGACADVVIAYCSDETNYETDVAACSSFLDLFVRCEYGTQSVEEQQALTLGVTNGRNGKGIIYVWSAGNDFGTGSDVNLDGRLNNRMIISVGAVGKDKRHSSYSSPGAALLVSAPGGDVETTPNNIVALAGGGCTDAGHGTSYAAPVVSGVIALMLQVNNNLSWRDVQGIIASTSQKVFPTDASWTTNAAGFTHSYLYGFGIIDARAAVQAARTWTNYNAERPISAESGRVNVPIADFSNTNQWPESSVPVSAAANYRVESVNVYLDLSHSSRGHLDIVLISPQGTSSILAPGQRPENEQLGDDERWRLLTVRNWGEPATGKWTLRLIDRSRGDVSTCLDLPDWSVEFAVPKDDPLEFACWNFVDEDACENGKQSPDFMNFFRGIATSINDPKFTNDDGVSLVQACCACGGGRPSSSVPDVLRSWRLVIFGSVP